MNENLEQEIAELAPYANNGSGEYTGEIYDE